MNADCQRLADIAHADDSDHGPTGADSGRNGIDIGCCIAAGQQVSVHVSLPPTLRQTKIGLSSEPGTSPEGASIGNPYNYTY
jgi:hypothetical protein